MTNLEPEELVTRFRGLKSCRIPLTFLEIAGYPHYENVCSNLLAFYLKPQNEHGLRDLLLRALMNCLGMPWEIAIQKAEVEREFPTQLGRLDLLITTDEFVIGVENKIGATLYNDLEDYARSIAEKASQQGIKPEATHRVILTVRRLSWEELAAAERARFRVLLVSELISSVRSLYGHYASRAEAKHLSYLSDLMQTMENLGGAQNNELNQFFARHRLDVAELCQAYSTYESGIIPEVRQFLGETAYAGLPTDEVTGSIYQRTTLITFVRCREPHTHQAISVDLVTSPARWEIWLFARPLLKEMLTQRTAEEAWEDVSPRLMDALGAEFSFEGPEHLVAIYPANLTPYEMAAKVSQIVFQVRRVLGYVDSLPYQ